jgi:hypothetical protein
MGVELGLSHEHRLRIYEKRVLRGIFGPSKVEWVGGLRRLHKEELRNFYASPNINRNIKSRRVRWIRPGRIWGDNIRTDLREVSCEVFDLMHLAQDRGLWRAFVNTVLYLWVL